MLDLAPIGQGSSAGQALANSASLVAETERLGYTRYWVAEHHNMPGIASSSPAVLLAHLGAHAHRIRLGSGGVMLPNHSPLVVAEQFGMLEALHPGRIDLGIGRAPGTDQLTARALRRSNTMTDEFPHQLRDLLSFFSGQWPEGHPYQQVTAVPGRGHQPAMWLLGSSDYSAHAAGVLGLPFSFAYHFSAGHTLPALSTYRSAFQPSSALDKPYAMLGVAVICAATDDHAQWLAGPSKLAMVRLRTGRPGLYPSAEEAADYHFTPRESEVAKSWMASSIVGSPETVVGKLRDLLEMTGANELMLTTNVHGHPARVNSYRLVAELAGLSPST